MTPARPDRPPRGTNPYARPDGTENSIDSDDGATEVLEQGPGGTPWLAYVVLALLVLAGLGVGVHKLASSHYFSTAPGPTATATSSGPSSSPTRTASATPTDLSRLRPVGPSVSYADLFAQRVPGASSCYRSGVVLALRPSLVGASVRPMNLRATCTAPSSSTSVVMRRDTGGQFGEDSAIITYPAAAIDPSRMTRPTTHDGKAGYWDRRGVTWRVRGGYIQVQGDLPRAELARIAKASTVSGTHPRLHVVTLPTYHPEWNGPTNGDGLASSTYTSTQLGFQPGLGSTLVELQVSSGVSVEQRIYSDPAATVLGRTNVLGQNGVVLLLPSHGGVMVAWQVPPYAGAYVACPLCKPTKLVISTLQHVANATDLYALRVPTSTR